MIPQSREQSLFPHRRFQAGQAGDTHFKNITSLEFLKYV